MCNTLTFMFLVVVALLTLKTSAGSLFSDMESINVAAMLLKIHKCLEVLAGGKYVFVLVL